MNGYLTLARVLSDMSWPNVRRRKSANTAIVYAGYQDRLVVFYLIDDVIVRAMIGTRGSRGLVVTQLGAGMFLHAPGLDAAIADQRQAEHERTLETITQAYETEKANDEHP